MSNYMKIKEIFYQARRSKILVKHIIGSRSEASHAKVLRKDLKIKHTTHILRLFIATNEYVRFR